MIKLSIIIPVYNVEKYIEKCIKSVINQNLKSNEYEIIVIDDESPDNSVEIIEKLKNKDSQINLISQKNKGLGGARNTGLRNAKGDFILFLDSDDWYLPNVLNQIYTIGIKYSVDILEFGAQGINFDDKVVYSHSISSNDEVLNGLHYYQNYRYMDSACNKLYRRNFLIENELFFIEHIYIEDYEFNTRAFYKAKRVMAIDLIVAQFYQSPNSITRNFDVIKQEKLKEDIIIVIKRINALFINDKTVSNKFVSKYFEQRLGFLVATLFYQLVKKRASYNDFVVLKERLISENIFFIDFPIFDRKKEWFRKLFLKNFALFKIIHIVFKLR